MDKLGFLLSKKILVILSGFIFTGVTFASSGAGSLLQNTSASETKIPEVQKLTDIESSPSSSPSSAPAQQTPKTNNPLPPKPTTKPVTAASIQISATPKPLAKNNTQLPALTAPKITPKPTAATTSGQNTITGLRQSELQDQEDAPEDKEDEEEKNEEDKEDDNSSESEINKAFQETRREE